MLKPVRFTADSECRFVPIEKDYDEQNAEEKNPGQETQVKPSGRVFLMCEKGINKYGQEVDYCEHNDSTSQCAWKRPLKRLLWTRQKNERKHFATNYKAEMFILKCYNIVESNSFKTNISMQFWKQQKYCRTHMDND